MHQGVHVRQHRKTKKQFISLVGHTLIQYGLLTLVVLRTEAFQAPAGKCQGFKWGGVSGTRWFTCCHNCQEEDRSCDNRTYQSASDRAYCGSCGTTTDQGVIIPNLWEAEFGCGSCGGQNFIQSTCTSNIMALYQIKGFCWAFTMCFRRKCLRAHSTKRSATDAPDSCFNLRCDPGETVENCPTDCCSTVNPEKCTWASDKCLDPCCGESACCRHASGSHHLQFNWLFHCITVLPLMHAFLSHLL